ncbi:asparaginase domain-containing protein [Bacteriovorax sp. Seq25_V]|uniref:asparaginase domain-containing protein n=1 Tax=Bacteriovorax sp. Seq25_V TaxID=1201288 RepID=UPI00038A1707|nr:asparaginase domain-containing protein [Bacteriovorax sp. Seq25_V]EQC46007.1 asparaginase domain protein [Bacteriovorax sp. Seq25_V]
MNKIENREDIILITTGGTIDKSYDESDGSLTNKESILNKEILSYLRLPYTKVHVFNIINKDSLHFTDYDRNILVKTLSVQLEKKCPIIVLHGTDTMAKSAEYCLRTLGEVGSAIVFTGAMKPMGFTDSDAFQNVTEALIASKILSPGIYISFHNRIFSVPGVRKNLQRRTFEEY